MSEFRKSPAINRVLLVGNFIFDFYAPAWQKALESLGIHVIRFDYNEYWSGGILGRIERHLLIGPALKRINRSLVCLANKECPDVILIYAGLPIKPQTVKLLAQRWWVAGYHNDDPFGQYGQRPYFRWYKAGIPFYSSHHVYRKKNIDDYSNKNVVRIGLLMAYYCPWVNFPMENKNTPVHEVIFIGNGEEGLRARYISYLLEKNVNLKLYGPSREWKACLPKEVFAKLAPIEVVLGEKYSELISNAKISLAFFNTRNNDQYTRRVFEIPACRGFLLAQRTPVMLELYREGVEAEFFSSEEELLEKISFYLNNEQIRVQIAEAGYRRCVNSGYDVYSRMRQWLNDTQHWKDTL